MVPFSLRVLLALAPHLWGSSVDSITAFALLLQHCTQQLQATSAIVATAAAVKSGDTTGRTAETEAGNNPTNLQMLWKARLIKTAFLLALVLSAANYPEVLLLLLLLLPLSWYS